MNETATALSIIGQNCLNARNIHQRVVEFIETLESHPNFRDLRSSIDRMLTLINESEKQAANEASVVNVNDSVHQNDLSQNLEDDPNDYMLTREFKRAETTLSSKLNSLLTQLHSASVSDLVGKIEAKISQLEDANRAAKASFEASKGNETNFAKQCLEAQRNLQSMSEKHDKLVQLLKDRKNEMKKLEKKAKSEIQLAAENTELHDKIDALKKELIQVQRHLSEEQAKYKRDTQSLADSKKHLNAELNTKYSEIQKLSNQLDERAQALKKSESQLANERKSNAVTVANLNDRAKKSEIALLDQRLDDGLRVLERAKDDCSMQIKQLEDIQKKSLTSSELDVIKKNIAEWEIKREEVASLIVQSKSDFNAHIASIKSGKQLAQLPKIQVPKPPPCPKLHPMPQPQPQHQMAGVGRASPQHAQQLPLERKVITPPSSNRSASTRTIMDASNSQQQQMQPSQQQQHFIGQAPAISPGANFATMGSHSTNVTPMKLQISQIIPASSNCAAAAQSSQHGGPPHGIAPPLTPIGVRPHNYQNGALPNKSPGTAAMHQQLQQQHARQSPTAVFPQSQQQQFVSLSHHGQQSVQPPPNLHGQQQMSNGYPPQQPPPPMAAGVANGGGGGGGLWSGAWGDQLNNISELLGHGRSFGPLGSEFGRGETASNNPMMSSASRSSVPTVPGATTGGTASVIGSGRNHQNASPSAQNPTQQQQHNNNGWTAFGDTAWNASISGRQS